MPFWTLAKKDLRLLLRDPRAVVILLLMPLVLILVLGLSLGEGFGQKPAERLRVSVLNEDQGLPRFPAREASAWLSLTQLGQGGHERVVGAALFAKATESAWFPPVSWAEMVLRDLGETAFIQVELIPTRQEAEELVRTGRRAAVLVLGPNFSKRVQRCSFLAGGWGDALKNAGTLVRPGDPVLGVLSAMLDERQSAAPLYLHDGINPFFRDGVKLEALDVEVLRDRTQETAAAIIDQVAQGTLLRVVMPWMIGRAFEKIADPQFLTLLGQEPQLPFAVKFFLTGPGVSQEQKKALSVGLQNAIQNLFPKYNLTAKTWAALTKEDEHRGGGASRNRYEEEAGGWLKRGAIRYQLLVPSYLVMFAFFLVLTVGWLFTSERRQGTMLRLRVSPLTRGQILLGKLIPCLTISLFQGIFLLVAGKVLFGMNWGPNPGWLLAVVACTSLAAMGLAMLVAATARTETQVAIAGTLLVLVLAGLSGSLMGDRELMPEPMKRLSLLTPHAWALDAYRQLLTPLPNPQPNLALVAESCAVLAAFGLGLLLISWWCMKLD